MSLDACRSGTSARPFQSTTEVQESFDEIPVIEFTFTQDESRPSLKIPKHRVRAEDEGYLIAMKAVIEGDLRRLGAALALGIEVHAIYANATTLLNEAAAQGRPPIIEALLQWGASPNVKDCDPFGPCAPLYWAARWCRVEAVKILLNAGAELEATAKRDESALTAVLDLRDSINQDQFDCLALLLEAGIDVNLQKSRGESLLGQAIQFERHDLIDLLIDRGASIRGSLEIAVDYAELETMKLLLDRGARDEPGDPALLSALASKRTDLVQELLFHVERPYSKELRERVDAIPEAKEDGPLKTLLQIRGFDIQPKIYTSCGDMMLTTGRNLTGYGSRLVGYHDADGTRHSFLDDYESTDKGSTPGDGQDYNIVSARPSLESLPDGAEFSFTAFRGINTESATFDTHGDRHLQVDIERDRYNLPQLTMDNLRAHQVSRGGHQTSMSGSAAPTAAFSDDGGNEQENTNAAQPHAAENVLTCSSLDNFDPDFWNDVPLSQFQ